jgi:hypothetical protein
VVELHEFDVCAPSESDFNVAEFAFALTLTEDWQWESFKLESSLTAIEMAFYDKKSTNSCFN